MGNRTTEAATVSSIMRTDVLTVGPQDTLSQALETMIENHVTGLPVLDAKDRCVGLISSADILRFEQDHAEEATEANADMARFFDQERQRWEDVRVTAFALEELAETPVGDVMTRELITAAPETTVRDAARTMIENDVHRVLVLDDEGLLLGVVSALDFARLVAEL